jgi:hypothetical protein
MRTALSRCSQHCGRAVALVVFHSNAPLDNLVARNDYFRDQIENMDPAYLALARDFINSRLSLDQQLLEGKCGATRVCRAALTTIQSSSTAVRLVAKTPQAATTRGVLSYIYHRNQHIFLFLDLSMT